MFLAPRLVARTLRPTTVRYLAGFTMEALKELRAVSGAPISECKKALEASENDPASAMDWLREHGAAKAAGKLQGRVTEEGLIGLSIDRDARRAALVQVASETDFAGRSAKFVQLVENVTAAVLSSATTNGTLSEESLLAAQIDGRSVKDLLDEAIVAIRENLSIPSAMVWQATDDSLLIGYVHNRIDASSMAGTAAAVVELSGENNVATIGKRLAMHIVAARPQYLTPDQVPDHVIDKERGILLKQQEESGKPADIMAKVGEGRLRKFYEGICLTEQAHMIEEGNPKIGKYLAGKGVEVKRFASLSIS